MTKKTFTITLSILAILFIVQHIYIKQPDILEQVSASEKYSDVEINLLDGGFEPIGYYKDKEPVVLVFWASSSNPSQLVFDDIKPRLKELNEKDSFTLIAVNVGDSKSAIEKTKKLWGLDMKIGLDPEGKIAQDFGVGSLPTVIFINKKGDIKRRWVGFEEDIGYKVRNNIRAEYKDKEDSDISDFIDTSGSQVDTIIKDGDTTIRIRTK
jgi:thiol-disulfide isomerase/thioredoxin